jgi:hypothetical protein
VILKPVSLGYSYPPPTDGKPFRLIMGLRTVEPAGWLEGGDGRTISLAADDVLLQISSIIGEDLVVLSREGDEWRIVAGQSHWHGLKKIRRRQPNLRRR